MKHSILILVLSLSGLSAGSLQSAELPPVFEDNFEKGLDRWQLGDPNAWKLLETPMGKVLSLHKQSKHKPPHRSPINIALIKNLNVADFVLTVKVQSTIKDYDHRDMCLFFGYQGPAQFYYVHFGKRTDDHANQVFIVNDAPRTKISTKTTPGTPWTDEWHTVRVERNAESGSIKVYFDDLKEPVMTATDKTFAFGQVGVGSFDDIGNFDDVRLNGIKVEYKEPTPQTK